MKILVIEDEPLIRSNLRHLLEAHGHTVMEAATGEEGVIRACEHPDFVLCDVGLPGMDGFAVIGAIHKMPGGVDVPFIFLTARSERSDQRAGMSLGADDYITKPFAAHEVIDAIAARVARQKSLRERIQQLLRERESAIAADWSHELMTPLNGMLGCLELLEAEADNVDQKELRELLGLIRQSAERQHQLSRKLVRYYDLERAKLGRPPEGVESDARATINAVVSAARAASPERSNDVVMRALPGHVAISEQELKTAVDELLENALRYSKPGQPVGVSGFAEDGRYCIEVCDEGPGFTSDERANLRPFVRFPRAVPDQCGLGLGLAIVGSVATVAGGGLALQPRPCGIGSVATLTLPMVPDRG